MTDHEIWRKSYLSAAQAAAMRAKWWRRVWRMLALAIALLGFKIAIEEYEPWRSMVSLFFGGIAGMASGHGQILWWRFMDRRQQHLDALRELEREWREQR